MTLLIGTVLFLPVIDLKVQSYVDNPRNEFNPKFIPLTIFNLSRVDHLYIGKDNAVAFADKQKTEVYNVEISSDD